MKKQRGFTLLEIILALVIFASCAMMQSTLFALGELVPVVVSIIATSGLVDLPITATPMVDTFLAVLKNWDKIQKDLDTCVKL